MPNTAFTILGQTRREQQEPWNYKPVHLSFIINTLMPLSERRTLIQPWYVEEVVWKVGETKQEWVQHLGFVRTKQEWVQRLGFISWMNTVRRWDRCSDQGWRGKTRQSVLLSQGRHIPTQIYTWASEIILPHLTWHASSSYKHLIQALP